MLLYWGHLVRQCNWAVDNANTGTFAFEGLHIVMCLLDSLNMGQTLWKYERIIATALLCHTRWHSAMPGQAFAKELCLSPRKLHPLLEEKDLKNDRPKNYFFR